MAKIRLDVYLFEKGYAKSRSAAQALIMEGIVFVDNQKAMKAGDMISGDEQIEVRGKTLEYVSRGGLKLEKAMKSFGISLDNCVCMDIGASTGGFTDCMLKNGATKVYSVDVGYGQLAWKLRQDERVVNMERTNIRYVTRENIEDDLDFFSVDVSFISLKKVLPVAHSLLKDGGRGACLIKPQFEAGREKVGKKGVVRDISVHKEVIENVLEFTKEIGFSVRGLDFSPIKGPEGNIEYLMYVEKSDEESLTLDIDKIIEESHQLNK
ncbi:MAG: TlyA family RNA methyltransferase [Clostridia bacterium]|nr:TlyA family RNA methyltransferase [Clostridia bacterium]